jgi:hypothetical protein
MKLWLSNSSIFFLTPISENGRSDKASNLLIYYQGLGEFYGQTDGKGVMKLDLRKQWQIEISILALEGEFPAQQAILV